MAAPSGAARWMRGQAVERRRASFKRTAFNLSLHTCNAQYKQQERCQEPVDDHCRCWYHEESAARAAGAPKTTVYNRGSLKIIVIGGGGGPACTFGPAAAAARIAHGHAVSCS